jgi:hypothetical protein
MRDVLIVIAIIVSMTLIHRVFAYFYFKEDLNSDSDQDALRDNKIRNQTERSGITPGGVSWVQPVEYAPKAPLDRRYPRWVAAQGRKYALKRKMGKWK